MAQEKQKVMMNPPQPIRRYGADSGNDSESSEDKEEQLAMVSQEPIRRLEPRAALNKYLPKQRLEPFEQRTGLNKYLPKLEPINFTNKGGTGSGNVGESSKGFRDPKAKEEQLAMVSQEPIRRPFEQRTGLNKYLPKLEPINFTNKGGTGSGNVGESSKGFRDPNDSIDQEAQARMAWINSILDISWSKIPGPGLVWRPGLWPSSFSNEHCCIYRVPNRLRGVNPEAYTPQMILIGPLHYYKKAQTLELSKTDYSRYLDYMNMEIHKKKYLNDIANIHGQQTIDDFRKIIERNEKTLRESYAESTDWIESSEFVKMMLLDSVFILKFFIRIGTQNINKKGDILFEEPCLVTTILEDLMLLENQIPYALLASLFEPFFLLLDYKETFRDLTLRAFRLEGKIKEEVTFTHFTDLFRHVRIETLGLTEEQINSAQTEPPKSIKSLHNADKLDSAGVDFMNIDENNDLSLVMSFEDGILKMPCFTAEDSTERVMRNIMALEQCHYPLLAYVCNYITFLDFLIDTEQDVDLLVKKGVVKNWLGHQGSVAEMVNKLCLGLVDFGSHYYDIAESINKHYDNRLNRSVATLRRVYFKDLWTGTATVAAVIILVLTLIGTVASVIQVLQNTKESPLSPPPARGP